MLFPICVCVCIFFPAYQNFCRRAEFQSCISCVCPLVIVCVHQAKCWPRMKGLFPSGFNESVCCLLTKRPTPIHLDFLHVFFSVVCFFFLLGSFAKSLQSTKCAPSTNWYYYKCFIYYEKYCVPLLWLHWFILSLSQQGTYSLQIEPSIPP